MYCTLIGGANGNNRCYTANTVSDLIEIAVSFVAFTVSGSGTFNGFHIFLFTAFSALKRTHTPFAQIHVKHLVSHAYIHMYTYISTYAQ